MRDEGPRAGFNSVRDRVHSVGNMSAPPSLTQLLVAWSDGDPRALEGLVPVVESELRRLARSYLLRNERTTPFRRLPSSTKPIYDSSTSVKCDGRIARISLVWPPR